MSEELKKLRKELTELKRKEETKEEIKKLREEIKAIKKRNSVFYKLINGLRKEFDKGE